MKNKLYKTAKAVVPSLLLSLFLLPACSDNSSTTPDIPETKYAKLTITLGSADNAEPGYTKAGVENGYGDNDIHNPDSADTDYERHIDDWWIVVLDGDKVERVLSNRKNDDALVSDYEEDNKHTVQVELVIGKEYGFYAFANLVHLADNSAKEYLLGLQTGTSLDLKKAVALKGMAYYDAQNNSQPIPMSSYAYKATVYDDITKNQVEIPLIRLIGKVGLEVTNSTGKEVTVNSITMGKFRTTGNIYLLPYDAATGMNTQNLLLGKSSGTDDSKLLNPLFPTTTAEAVGTDIIPTLPSDKKILAASGANSERTYSFYVNETAQENQVDGTKDMEVSFNVSGDGIEKDPEPRPTKFFFVRRNDWLKIPVLISDANTQVSVEQQHMPIGGLPIKLTFPDGAIISDQTVSLDHGGLVKIGYSLVDVNGQKDWSLKYYTDKYTTGEQFCNARVVTNDKLSNGEGLILQGDTATNKEMWTNLKWLGGTDEKPVYGYKLTPDKETDGTTDSPTTGSFTIRVQELVSGTAKVKLTLVATKDETEVILPYTLTINFGKEGGN